MSDLDGGRGKGGWGCWVSTPGRHIDPFQSKNNLNTASTSLPGFMSFPQSSKTEPVSIWEQLCVVNFSHQLLAQRLGCDRMSACVTSLFYFNGG